MVTDPSWAGFGRALGLFVLLWWTWIGFVVLCNRHHEDRIPQRLFVLAGTLPSAVAAVETHAAADGHAMAFLIALAGARLILALAFAFTFKHAKQVTAGYGVSTVIFVASAFAPAPWRYVLLAFALLTMAAGVSLALLGKAPPAAAWFITGGLAAYLMGSRALVGGGRVRSGPLLRAAVVAVTVCLALLRPAISTTSVVLVTAAWACAIAAYVTWRFPERLKGVTADPLTFFRPPHAE